MSEQFVENSNQSDAAALSRIGRKRKTLQQAQQDVVDPDFTSQDEIIDVEVVESSTPIDSTDNWVESAEEEIGEQLIGWNPQRRQFKFITNNPALLIRLTPLRTDKDGNPVITALGANVRDEIDIKFKNGAVHIQDKSIVKQMLSHPNYGGTAKQQTENADPLFWLDNFPAHEWASIKRRMKYITQDEGEYES